MSYKFAVVTRVPDPQTDDGNLAVAIVHRVPLEIQRICLINGRVEVFTKGEILILDEETGREISGSGRKPDKWDIDTEEFDTIEQAIEKALEINAS